MLKKTSVILMGCVLIAICFGTIPNGYAKDEGVGYIVQPCDISDIGSGLYQTKAPAKTAEYAACINYVVAYDPMTSESKKNYSACEVGLTYPTGKSKIIYGYVEDPMLCTIFTQAMLGGRPVSASASGGFFRKVTFIPTTD